MAVFFDHQVRAPVPGTNNHICWHQNFGLLAVASTPDTGGGSVNLYYEEGEHLAESVQMKHVAVTALAWHPTKRILAATWENGEVSMWNEQDRELYEASRIHKEAVSCIRWSSTGTRLVTADTSGGVVVWKADSRGRLQQNPVAQHFVGDHFTQLVLKPPPPVDPANDIASLARAAVSGDESALDMFNWKKGKNNSRLGNLGPTESATFFVGGKTGGVYFLNDVAKLLQVFSADGPVMKLLYYEERSILVTVTTTMMLSQHSVLPDGVCQEMLKVKLSGRSQNPDIIWAGKGVLATATGESIIRMWDIEKEENYILNLEGQSGYNAGELLTCISFSANKGVLAGGTGAGHVAMWKFSALVSAKCEPEERWKLQPPSTISGSISQLAWGSSKNLLGVNTVENVFILNEQVMCAAYCNQLAVVQSGPMALAVDLFTSVVHHDLKTDIQVKGLTCSKEGLAILDGKKSVIYEVTGEGAMIRAAGTFSTESPLICMYEQNIYTIEPGKVQVRTFQGTVKQLLSCTEAEGEPIAMHVSNNFLIVTTSNTFVKVYDLSRREAKQHCSPKHFSEVIPCLGAIVSAKCNCIGSRVSIIVTKSNGNPDPKLYVWDVELDTVQYFNLESGRGEEDEYMATTQGGEVEDFSDADKGKNQAALDIQGRHPVSHFWDSTEPKLLVSEAKLLPDEQRKQPQQQPHQMVSLTKNTMDDMTELMVVSLFVTPENGILIQDNFAMANQHNNLLGLDVPYFYFSKKEYPPAGYMVDLLRHVAFADELGFYEIPDRESVTCVLHFSDMSEEMTTNNEDSEASIDPNSQQSSLPRSNALSMVARRVMRDFVGLEYSDKNARDAMMNFSYFLTIGNMDEAFKAIKLIKSESVWENMAKMCVKTRRLDVASVCLGNMGHARGAKLLRESLGEQELDARVATLAIQLGLQEDAERLLKNCKRYDLLNDIYQASGQWGKAMETAEAYDRVHLRTTYYNYAKHLESKGDIEAAIPNFEKSDTHRFEVPRMLFDEPQSLESYIMKTRDPVLRKWWAQYMESTGEMTTAIQFYEAAQDFLSLVRVYCYCADVDKAAEICNETGDRAACYRLAQQYENDDNIRQAIHFFTRAQAYGNAIRLCKEHGMEDQLMNLALMGRPENMVDAARYYEDKPNQQDKAVMLYHKAGHFSRALDLAFRTKQFAALQMISEDLDEKTDPQLLQHCADFFIENGQFDRAVDLLAIAKKYWEALKLCMEQHVPVSEELVEKLTPGKDLGENEGEERNKILEGIAEVCMQQRQYHLATKKYTQAGNKIKAMKALLKSGDTEKIVFFAGVSRQKEVYVMAANYLQSLDWRKDPEIMKNIISFYTKGRALDLLAGFYDACGQVEIDEYQNYDKALGAMAEAYKCLSKAKMKNQSLQEERLADLKHRMNIIKKFIAARRLYDEDNEEAIKQCQVLLEEEGLDSAVRIGDIYGFIVEHYARKEKWKAAYTCMEDLKAKMPKVNITFYVNMKTIEAVYSALDIPLRGTSNGPVNGISMGGGEEEDGEEVEEDVIDDFTNEQSYA